MTDRVEQYYQQIANAAAIRALEMVETITSRCESPIERLLMAALYENDRVGPPILHYMGSSDLPERPAFGNTAFVHTQAKLGKYRADIAIMDATLSKNPDKWRLMIVECDGHDFHERTKEQARKDKARDRYFQSRGYKVLHFTGSEIWADPDACAQEVLNELAIEDEWRKERNA